MSLLSEVYLGNFFMLLWLAYVVLPIFDFILPVDHSNLPKDRVRIVEKD